MLKENKYGELVQVSEINPYNFTSIDRHVPVADYVEVDSRFSPGRNKWEQNYNEQAEALIKNHRLDKKAQVISEQAQKEKELNVYRNQIAQNQASRIILTQDVLKEMAVMQNMRGPDFSAQEIYGNGTNDDNSFFPNSDYDRFIEASKIGYEGETPNSLRNKDISDTYSGGQMAGYLRPQMGDFWSDIGTSISTGIEQGVTQWEQQVQQDVAKSVVQAGSGLIQSVIPQTGTPQPVPAPTTVQPVPTYVPQYFKQPLQQASSALGINPKTLLYIGGGLVGTILLITVLKIATK